jgi:hypothetical protein
MDFPDVGSFRPLWISTMTHVRESEISPMREIPPGAIMGTYERIRSSLLTPSVAIRIDPWVYRVHGPDAKASL